MNAARFEEGPERTPVTQEEASRMVELWSRTADPAAQGLLDLRDVTETLRISEAEGLRLLARVRNESIVAPSPTNTPQTTLLYVLLGLSLALSTLFLAAAFSAYHHFYRFDAADLIGTLLALVWTFGWFSYYRRPIARAVGGFGRRIARGKP